MTNKRQVGRTGVEVHPIGLGAWQLSNTGRPNEEHAVALIRAAVEAGVELIDTADCYCADDSEFGHNERLVAKALSGPGRATTWIATKVGHRRPGGAWVPDGRPERVKRCCDESLQRLGTDTIFLYQLHRPDPNVPIEDTVGAMLELKTAGKIEHIGLSNVDESQLRRALSVTRVESVQNACNPWQADDVHNGMVEFCQREQIAYLPYYPVGGRHQHASLAGTGVLRELASKYQVSTYQVLLNWLLGLGPQVIPIPGATRIASITDSLGADSFSLAPADRQRLAAAAQ